MKIVYITNIPTPYRNLFYNELNKKASKENIQIEVWYMAWTENDRHWKFQESDFEYTYKVFNGKTYHISNIKFHINFSLIKEIKKYPHHISIIGGYSSPSHILSSFLSKAKIKILWSETNLHSTRKNIFLKKIKQFLLSPFDYFLVPGINSKKYLLWINNTIKDSKFLALPNLIDESLYVKKVKSIRTNLETISKIKQKYSINETEIIWFCPARIEKFKGLDVFLPHLKGLHNYKLLIAGDGSLKNELIELCKKLNLNVFFIGQKNMDEMLELYSIADLFVLPSMSDPSPLSPIEASAAQLPLLLSKNIGNIEDVLVENINGFSFNPNNSDEVIECLKNISNLSKNELAALGKSSIDLYHKNFDVNTWITNHINDLKKLN